MKDNRDKLIFVKPAQSGFTLVEMMAALAVVSVGVAAAISLVASMGLNTARLEEKVQAQWIVANIQVQIRLNQVQQFKQNPVDENATVEMGGRDWYVFSQHRAADFPNSVATTVSVCLDQQRQNCVLEQDVVSSGRKVSLASGVTGGN